MPSQGSSSPLASSVTSTTTAFLLLASTAAAIGTIALWLNFARRKQKRGRSGEFVPAGHVDQLYVYPIKSCKPNRVEWMDCGERGGRCGDEQDRHFLLVDALKDNLLLTGRIYPKMLLIESHVQGQTLVVSFPRDKVSEDEVADVNGQEKVIIEVDLAAVQQRNEIRRACLWSGKCTEGLDCGDQIGQEITRFLGAEGKRELRLIWFHEHLFTERDEPSKPEYWHNNPVPQIQDKIAYNDLSSYLAFSMGSVHDINAHLRAKDCPEVDARNFRPNLVIGDLDPFDEDLWLRVRAGEAEFICYKPCQRCVMTTIHPDKGQKSEKMEPLKELRTYRLAPGKLYEEYKDSPIFGVSMAIVKPGRVRVGDPVWIEYKPSVF